ncbi:MAG: PIN domain-containing protein [Actinomycetota bacterium]|nr:PIN domain-containing protein [Actinomycetota bacterium]
MREHARGVLDTSVVVALETYDPAQLPDLPVITAVTLAELSAGPLLTDDPSERAARQARLQEVEASFDPLPFDAAAARAFARVRVALDMAGKQLKPRAFDALIAATALSVELPLFTANPQDVPKVDGLDVVALSPPAGAT